VLLKGVLTDRADHLPSNLETLRARSQAFRGLVAESGLPATPAQTAIAFALAQRAIHSVLIGVRTVEELADNLPALSLHLSEPYLRQLAALRLDDPVLLNPATWGIP
jgi:aryl-alcohol dehydrogenase-like predicted oxidoreductase